MLETLHHVLDLIVSFLSDLCNRHHLLILELAKLILLITLVLNLLLFILKYYAL